MKMKPLPLPYQEESNHTVLRCVVFLAYSLLPLFPLPLFPLPPSSSRFYFPFLPFFLPPLLPSSPSPFLPFSLSPLLPSSLIFLPLSFTLQVMLYSFFPSRLQGSTVWSTSSDPLLLHSTKTCFTSSKIREHGIKVSV